MKYPTPDALEAVKGQIPPTLYQDQRKLFRDIDTTVQRLAPKPTKPAERGAWGNLWDWWQQPSTPRRAPQE